MSIVNIKDRVNVFFAEPCNERYFYLKHAFHINIKNFDSVEKFKKNYEKFELFTNINKRVVNKTTYNVIFKNYPNVEYLKKILEDFYNDISEYGFISEEQYNIYKTN